MNPSSDSTENLNASVRPADEDTRAQDLERFRSELGEHEDWRKAGRHMLIDVMVSSVIAQGRASHDDPWAIAEVVIQDVGPIKSETLVRLLLALYVYRSPDLVESGVNLWRRYLAEMRKHGVIAK